MIPTAAGASRTHATNGATTAAASALTPRSVLDANERWFSRPTYTSPRWVVEIPPTCSGAPTGVQRAELAQVTEAGPVAGREDDRVDPLPLVVTPHDFVPVERDEHGPHVDQAVRERLLEPDAVGDQASPADFVQPRGRQRVKPGLPQPVVHVLAGDSLWDESERVPDRER